MHPTHYQLALLLIAIFIYGGAVSGSRQCAKGYFQCQSSRDCILLTWRCDGSNDCDDDSDEKDCQANKKSCGIPEKPLHGSTEWKSDNVGSLATSRCFPTYTLIGPSVRLCQSNKQWSGVKPVCSKDQKSISSYCPALDYLANGRIYTSSHSIGSSVQYECDTGFKLLGTNRRICKKNGQWSRSSPICEMIGCNELSIPNGRRLGQSFSFGSSVRFFCDHGFEMIGKSRLFCLGRDQWSDQLPECLDPATALKRKAGEFTKSFLNRMKVLTLDGQGRSGFAESAIGLDLVFVLDYSQSVGQTSFARAVKFTRSIIDEFGLSETEQGTHVAVVLFGTRPRILFGLTSQKVYEVKVALKELESVQFQGGGTGTRDALDLVLHGVANETRPGAKKVLFIITDGKHNVGGDPTESAKQLRNIKQFEIFTIGISSAVDRAELESIASLPFDKHIYLLNDFKMLDKLKDLIKKNSVDYSSCGSSGDTKQTTNTAAMIESNHGAWPFVTALYVAGKLTCAGALISNTWVMTAAKCVKGVDQDDIRIISGMHRRSRELGSEQRRKIKKIVRHPHNLTTDNDIALLQLEKPVKYGEYTRAICQPADFDWFYVRPQKTAFIVGWGFRKKIKEVLHQGKLVIQQRKKCMRSSDSSQRSDVLCAGTGRSGEGVCSGTRGSPLMVQRKRKLSGREIYKWVVVGLLQKNTGCAKDGHFSSFINVLTRRQWITETLKQG